jgi:hypothetical protein
MDVMWSGMVEEWKDGRLETWNGPKCCLSQASRVWICIPFIVVTKWDQNSGLNRSKAVTNASHPPLQLAGQSREL